MFPVMGPLTIFDPSAAPPPAHPTSGRGKAGKRRGCNFVRLEWYLGPRNGRHVEVQFQFTDPPMLRETGELEWDGMVVSLAPQETLGYRYADVVHQCLWRPSLPRTPFCESSF